MTGIPVQIAGNNGTVGGGEMMQLALARAFTELGHPVTVLGPAEPADLVERAAAAGFDVRALPGRDRGGYARSLRRWARRRPPGLLWCNGLVPALATAGLPDRVVHLHRLPDSRGQRLATRIATRGSLAVVVPSAFMAAQLHRQFGGALGQITVLANWTTDLDPVSRVPDPEGHIRIGFLGRLTRDKGLPELARAVAMLEQRQPDRHRLLLAGEARFGDAEDAAAVAEALAPIEHLVDRLGWVRPEEFFARVDLAVFPSVWPEPFGLVVAEAMAAGAPFVITDAGALREVAGSEHRWVARAADAADLAEVLADAVAELPITAAERERQRGRWQREFSPAAGRDRLAAVLDSLAPSTGRGGAR